jgi:transcriptional regulator PpsR
MELNFLVSNLREHGAVRHFFTLVRGEFDSSEDVEISAVAVTGGEQPCYGFTVRSVARRPDFLVNGRREMPRSVEQLTQLVGRVALKDLVRESTDVIERLCIEAALELTGDNRASAADMLGLSRQSLYSKLRRHGLGDLDNSYSS